MWNLSTIDGYFNGSNDWEIDFHNHVWGDELEKYSIEQSEEIGALLFGRITYEGMAAHWSKEEGKIADFMNSVPKYVFSDTLQEVNWNNSKLVKSDTIDFVKDLKNQSGKDIYIFGSANLASNLLDLIEEYRICIVPIALGQGMPLFQNLQQEIKFELMGVQVLESGGVIQRLKPIDVET